jgi:hypothetical protein
MKKTSKIPITKFVVDATNELFVCLVKVKLNKHEFNFLLDTGSSISQVDKSNSINANDGIVKANTANGEINIQHEDFNLALTDDSSYDVTVALTDLTDVNNTLKVMNTPDEVVGVLGLDLLLLYNAVISFKDLTITLEDE